MPRGGEYCGETLSHHFIIVNYQQRAHRTPSLLGTERISIMSL